MSNRPMLVVAMVVFSAGPLLAGTYEAPLDSRKEGTVKFTVALPPHSKKAFAYTLTTYNGVRTEDWSKSSK